MIHSMVPDLVSIVSITSAKLAHYRNSAPQALPSPISLELTSSMHDINDIHSHHPVNIYPIAVFNSHYTEYILLIKFTLNDTLASERIFLKLLQGE